MQVARSLRKRLAAGDQVGDSRKMSGVADYQKAEKKHTKGTPSLSASKTPVYKRSLSSGRSEINTQDLQVLS